MATFKVRVRTPEDDVSSTGRAAKRLRMSPYGVAKAFKAGRIPGFQDPTNRRIWIYNSHLDQVDPQGQRVNQLVADIETHTQRIEALEEQASASSAAGAEAPPQNTTGPNQREVDDLRAQLTTANAVNLALLAAADERSSADAHANRAKKHLTKAVNAMAKARKADQRAAKHLRDAISQTQLPGHTGF